MLLCYAMGASSEIEYKKRAAREASKLFVFFEIFFHFMPAVTFMPLYGAV